MPLSGRDLALVAVLLSTTTVAFSCDGLLGEHRAPLSVEVAKTPPWSPSDGVVEDSGARDGDVEMSLVETDAPIVAIDGGDSGYERMCRHYCATLGKPTCTTASWEVARRPIARRSSMDSPTNAFSFAAVRWIVFRRRCA
jgi:hypothetical protein